MTLAGFCGAGSLMIHRLLLQSLDFQLTVPIDRISRELHPRADFARIFRNANIIYGNDVEEGRLLILVRNIREDRILYQKPDNDWLSQVDPTIWKFDLPNDAPPPPPHPSTLEIGREPPFHPFDHEKGRGKGMSPHDFPIPEPLKHHFVETKTGRWRAAVQNERGYTVFMARNLSEFDQEMGKVLKSIFIAAPFCLLLIGVGGWFIGHRAMKPLTAITKAAGNISARELKERIPVKKGEYLEFSNLILVFNQMMDRLEKGFSHAMRFSADVSHELKTPITIMQAEISTALKACPPESNERQALEVINQETQRLKAITGSLMLLSQAESGRLVPRKDKISLSNEVNDLCEDAEILCEREKLTLETEIQPGIFLTTDKTLLHQALLNLVSNAVKYNNPAGWIKIHLSKHDLSGQAVFQISNSGPGIPPDELPHIFERFYRVNKARDRLIDGFGLGLNLSFEIILMLGGELELIKADPSQTVFQVRIPVDN